MDTIEYIQRQVEGLRQQTHMALQDTTDEHLNWTPPGTANSIGVTLLHTIGGEDVFVLSARPGR